MSLTQHSFPGLAEWQTAALDFISERITRAVENEDLCIVGLSGGSTPGAIYTELGKQDLPWDHVKFFLCDDRYVPASDEQSNMHLLRTTLLAGGKISEANIAAPRTDLPLDTCVEDYDVQLRTLLDDRLPHLVILGMGDDGHIASLFPPLPKEWLSESPLAVHTTTDRFAVHDRISAGVTLLGNADEALLLLKGQSKIAVFEEMMKSEKGAERWPMKQLMETGNVTVMSSAGETDS